MKLCLGQSLYGSQFNSGMERLGRCRGKKVSAESGRAQAGASDLQEIHYPIVRFKLEFRNVASSYENFIWTYQSDCIKSWLKHQKAGRETVIFI